MNTLIALITEKLNEKEKNIISYIDVEESVDEIINNLEKNNFISFEVKTYDSEKN